MLYYCIDCVSPQLAIGFAFSHNSHFSHRPESLGVVCGTIYVVSIILCQLLYSEASVKVLCCVQLLYFLFFDACASMLVLRCLCLVACAIVHVWPQIQNNAHSNHIQYDSISTSASASVHSSICPSVHPADVSPIQCRALLDLLHDLLR